MDAKPRAPLEQLRAAGREARRLLQKRGYEARTSVIDAILKDKNAPSLPGIPAYLPHASTLRAAQKILYLILREWRDECKAQGRQGRKRMEDIKGFFAFLQKKLYSMEAEFKEKETEMPTLIKELKEIPVMKYVFGPTRNRETTAAMHRFLVDSLATMLAKTDDPKSVTVSEFANWFLDWSDDLFQLWIKPEDRKSHVENN